MCPVPGHPALPAAYPPEPKLADNWELTESIAITFFPVLFPAGRLSSFGLRATTEIVSSNSLWLRLLGQRTSPE